MRLSRTSAIVSVLLASVALSGCNFLGFRSWTWHQKLTLKVTTPSGDVSGSSVVSVTIGADPKWWTVGFMKLASGHSLSGEAAVVEISPGRYLIALLKNYGYETALRTFAGDELKGISEEGLHRIFDRFEVQEETQEIPLSAYPMLVTFENVADPRTIREVRPDDLAVHFGPGVRLISMSLETTDEPITRGGISTLLPWLNWSKDELLKWGNGRNPVKFHKEKLTIFLGQMDFQRGR